MVENNFSPTDFLSDSLMVPQRAETRRFEIIQNIKMPQKLPKTDRFKPKFTLE